MESTDFVVIGAGIAGASAAYELAAKARVLLLERESQAGYHSTGRSAAVLTENYGNAGIRRLTMASRRFFEQPPEGFAEHRLLGPRGVLFVARGDQEEKLAAALGPAQALVPSIRAVSGEKSRELCPVLREKAVAGAIYEPDAMDLDVAAIHQGFLRGLRRRGGMLATNAEVLGLEQKAGSWQVRTRKETVEAAVVINAAGAWCDVVGALAGARPIGLSPKRRTAFTFDPPAGVSVAEWPVVVGIDEDFYIKPEGGRVMASPADETPVPPQDVQPEELDIALAVDRVERATTLKVTRIVSKWAGLRSFAPDKTPVVGRDRHLPGFVWLAGQGGYGIMTAPAMARAAAGLALEDRLPDDLAELGLTAAELSPTRLQKA